MGRQSRTQRPPLGPEPDEQHLQKASRDEPDESSNRKVREAPHGAAKRSERKCDLRKCPQEPAITRGKVRGEQDHGPDRTSSTHCPTIAAVRPSDALEDLAATIGNENSGRRHQMKRLSHRAHRAVLASGA